MVEWRKHLHLCWAPSPEIENFLATFRVRVEHFDFASPEQIQLLPGKKHFPTIRDAVPFVRDPKALALKVHGVGFQGNTEPGGTLGDIEAADWRGWRAGTNTRDMARL